MSSESRNPTSRYQSLLAPLSRATSDRGLQKRLSEVLALLDFNATLNRTNVTSSAIDLALLVTMGEMAATWAGVWLTGEAGRLEPGPRRGLDDPNWSQLSEPMFEVSESDFGRAWLAGESMPEPLERIAERSGASVLAPLTKSKSLVGLLLLGESKREYGEHERHFVELLAASAAASIAHGRVHEQLQHANRSLSLKVYQLHSLFDIARELNRPQELDRLNDALITHAMGRFLTTRAALVVDGKLVTRGLKLGGDAIARLTVSVARASLDAIRSVGELPEDQRQQFESLGISLLVPIPTSENKVVLMLGVRGGNQDPSKEDMEFLQVLATQAASAFDNLRLAESRAEQEKRDKEMAIAREIQRGLLPKDDPALEGWDIAAINIPCYEVGGDYYDFVDRPDGKLWFVIADVSGKGTGPALIMASVRASLRALSGLGEMSLIELASRLNDLVQQSTEMNKYVTSVLGALDPATGEIEYLNAGHCYPLILRHDGSVDRLEEGGTVIGMLPEIELNVATTWLAPGDLMVLYTDGLSETVNVEDEEFDESRILALMKKHQDKSAREVLGRLVSAARIFAAEAGLADDLTLMVLKRG